MLRSGQDVIKKFTFKGGEDKASDYLKRENSNFIYSKALLSRQTSSLYEEKYLLENILPEALVEKYKSGEIYIHDKSLAPYCNSTACKDIAAMGIPSLAKNMLESEPTKDFFYFTRHLSNIVVLMSQQISGACMLAGFSTVLASYLYAEEKYNKHVRTDAEIYKYIRSMIFELNIGLRSGAESPFSNITMEFGKPSDELKDQFIVWGGEVLEEKYGDVPVGYYDRINKIIIDVMKKGAGNGVAFTFPLITVPITNDFNWDNELFNYLLESMYAWGGVYLENFMSKPFENEYYTKLNPKIKPRDPEVSRSLCCRLQIPLDLLTKVGSGIFGSSTGSVGAVQVINLNMNRLLMRHRNNKEALFKNIEEDLELMQQGHQAKREWIEANKELYPTFFSFNDDLKNYFNVFSVSGMHEGMLYIGYGNGMKDIGAKIYAHEIMQFISKIVDGFIERDQVACGIEYAPGENASIKMARDDIRYATSLNKSAFYQGTAENPFLTAGCMLPFSETNIIDVIENHAEFQAYATSGSIFHNFLETELSPEELKKYIQRVFSKPINYMTITPTRSVCNECGTSIIGDMVGGKCANCGSDDISVWSRVIGYYKPVARKDLRIENGMYKGTYDFWSAAKRLDYASRSKLLKPLYDTVIKDV